MRQAAVMLIIKDGLILSVSRRDNQTKFGLVGGKSDLGELPEQTAIREVKEETGIFVKDCHLIFARSEPPDSPSGEWFYAYTYYASEWEGDPIPEEGFLLRWMTVSQLTSGENAAFPSYNEEALKAFREKYSDIYLRY